MNVKLTSIILAVLTGIAVVSTLTLLTPPSQSFQLSRLVYNVDGSKLIFEFKGVKLVDGSLAVMVVKMGEDELYTYYVNLYSREIYNINPDGTASPTGRTSILWFMSRPDTGETVPVLEGYGRVEVAEEDRLVISDYRGAREIYRPIGGLYILNCLEIDGEAIELVEYRLSENGPRVPWPVLALASLTAAAWSLASAEIITRIRMAPASSRTSPSQDISSE